MRWLAGLFVLVALPVLLFMALRVPVGETPDEWTHIARADSLLHGEIIGGRHLRKDNGGNIVPEAGVSADWGLLTATSVFPNKPLPDKILTPELLAQQRAVPWQNKLSFIGVPNTAPYMPMFYVPAAAGLGFGKLIGLGPYDAIRAGRVASALVYTLIGVMALLVAQRGQGLLFAALTLPMTLWLGASFNQDGLLIATAILAAALLTRPLPGRGYWVAAVLMAAVMAAKPPYIPMAGLFLAAALLWPVSGMRMWSRAIGATLVAAIPALAWLVISSKYVATDFVIGPPYHPGPLWPGDPNRVFGTLDRAAQMQVLLHDPLLMVTLPVQTMVAGGIHKLREMIGVLGTLDLMMSPLAYTIWFLALPLALFADMLPARTEPVLPTSMARRWISRLLALACMVAAIFAVYLSQYLTWTQVGSTTLDGVQGRYLLPVLPFLTMAVPYFATLGGSRLVRLLPWVGRAGAVAAAGAGLVMVPMLILHTYYRH
jgi:uncharacterized membrane protein